MDQELMMPTAKAVDLFQMKREFQEAFLRHSAELLPSQRLLDIGCGDLRGGVPLIEYLNRGNYFGVEKHVGPVMEGWRKNVGLIERKAPRIFIDDILRSCRLPGFGPDILWCFSTLIHIPIGSIQSFFAFLDHHLPDSARCYANVNLFGSEPHEIGTWNDFPCIAAPFKYYSGAAGDFGLNAEILGTLEHFGHHSGIAAQDNQYMLLITRND